MLGIRYKIIFIFIILVFSDICLAVTSGFTDGNDLLEYCENTIKIAENNWQATNPSIAKQFDESGVCIGYIDSTNQLIKDTYCPEPNLSNLQEIRIVVKYLKDNPRYLNMPASTLIIKAMKDAFPCN